MQTTAIKAKYNLMPNYTGSLIMAQRIVVVRKWGNSVGVALPADMVKAEGIKPEDKVMLTIKKVRPLKELFGTLKTHKSTEEIMKEIREGWD